MGKPRGGHAGEDGLHTAARNGDLNAINSILTSNPLAVNSRDKHSRTPLHLAAWSGHAEVVSYLCKHKADVGATAVDDVGAIHFASQKGHLEVVRILLSSGASIKATTRKGLTPLHYAVQGSHLELVKYLVRKGGNLGAKTKAGMTPLDLANNEEIRCFLEESERSSKEGDLNGKEKAEGPFSKQPSSGEETSGGGDPEAGKDKEVDDNPKRKSSGDDTQETSVQPKKPRVALGHLLSTDDTGDDEENL